MHNATFDERQGGYLCVLETKQGDTFAVHQFAPSRAALFRHLAGMMWRDEYVPKIADPVFFRPDVRLLTVTPADFIRIPKNLGKFLDE